MEVGGQVYRLPLRNVEAKESSHCVQLFLSSQAVLLGAACFSKISVLWFSRRMFSVSSRRRERSFDVAIGFAAACGIASIALLSADCDFSEALWPPVRRCGNMVRHQRPPVQTR